MKKLLLILFVIVSISAQDENKGQSIELPDFVITGKQSISLPTMKKVRPDLVPILSQDFFYPSFTPEDFTFSKVTMPEKTLANLMPVPSGYNAQLILGAGQYTLPTGEFNFGKSFESGQFYTKLWGSNTTDYEPYSDYNVSGIKLNTDFFIDRNAQQLPGLIIGLEGYFIRDDYYFYGSAYPYLERETQRGGVKISAINQYSELVKYGINLTGDYLDFKKTSEMKELKYSADGFVKFVTPQFDVKIDGEFTQQKLDHRVYDSETLTFYNAGGILTYKVSPNVYLKGGVKYYSGDHYNYGDIESEDLIAPYGEIGYKVNDMLSFTAAYNPHAKFLTMSDFLKDNRFVSAEKVEPYTTVYQTNFSVFEKYKSNITFNAKYAYDKYYEVNVGAEYSKIDNYHIYSLSLTVWDDGWGKFKVGCPDDVERIRVYTEALFHLGPFGWLYGSGEYRHGEYFDGAVTVAYEPKFLVDLRYGYKFDFGFSAEAGIIYMKDRMINLDSNFDNVYLDDYINLTADFRYSLTKSFDLTLSLNNILNRDNYLWERYLEKPFDFIAGIDYRF